MSSHRTYRALGVLLSALAAVGPFAIDTYLPSFLDIERSLAITPLQAQQTLTAYMVPFSLMTLWHGALADALGRRSVAVAGLLVFAAASLLCAAATTLPLLLLGRVLQGMSAGAGMVVSRAVVRDLLDGPAAQRMMSNVSMTFALAPAIAPVIGGWLQATSGWRSVFVFLALLTSGIALWCFRSLPETLPPERRRSLAPASVLRAVGTVLTSRPFLAVTLAMTLSAGGLFVYVLSAPVFLMRHLGLGPTDFYRLYIPITTALAAGSWISGRLAGRLSRINTALLGFGVMTIAAAANVTINGLLPPAPFRSIAPVVGYVLGMALTMPSLTLIALDLFPERRGLAASCQSFLQSGVSALISALIVPLAWGSTLGLAAASTALLGGGACCLGACLLYRRAGLLPG